MILRTKPYIRYSTRELYKQQLQRQLHWNRNQVDVLHRKHEARSTPTSLHQFNIKTWSRKWNRRSLTTRRIHALVYWLHCYTDSTNWWVWPWPAWDVGGTSVGLMDEITPSRYCNFRIYLNNKLNLHERMTTCSEIREQLVLALRLNMHGGSTW